MNASPPSPGSDTRRLNLGIFKRLALMVVLMFGFGWAMIPLYEKICEVTGINFLTKRDPGAERFARNTQVDTSRKVVVEFDANARGAWLFRPEVNAVEVHPGELVTVVYDLVNTVDRPTTGQAIPSYAPGQAAGYFRKLECFCFEQQTLDPSGSRKFPVVFVIDPKLPADVTTITLSYTFFEIEGVAPTPRGDAG